jgi:hypothetical protein
MEKPHFKAFHLLGYIFYYLTTTTALCGGWHIRVIIVTMNRSCGLRKQYVVFFRLA